MCVEFLWHAVLTPRPLQPPVLCCTHTRARAATSATLQVTSAAGPQAAFKTATATMPISKLSECPKSSCTNDSVPAAKPAEIAGNGSTKAGAAAAAAAAAGNATGNATAAGARRSAAARSSSSSSILGVAAAAAAVMLGAAVLL
jgi:hypothetical protein